MVTGANAGIGREIVDFLARKGAGVYMVCRNPERAEVAQKDVISKSKNDKVYVLQADCGLETDIRKMWNNFVEHRKEIISKERSIPASDVPDSDVRLDALVCNAGVLNNDKKITEEGVEQTFAIHLLFGTYLLSSLAMSALGNTPDSRLVVVSSGGMYNTKFPKWDVATATGNTPYDGQMAYGN